MIFCRPVCSRARRMAFSFASAPPLVKKILSRSPGVRSAISRAASLRDSTAKPGAMVQSLAACSWIAATTLGCWCPMLVFTSCEEKSR